MQSLNNTEADPRQFQEAGTNVPLNVGPAWGVPDGRSRDTNQAREPFLFPNYVQVSQSGIHTPHYHLN